MVLTRRDLEQDFRERLASLRCQSEQESEALLQQVERERSALQEELQLLRAQEAELQEELSSTAQEKQHLEDELNAVKMKLSEAESSVQRLQRDLDQLLHHKFGSLDPSSATLNHEERFSELLREYELQRRVRPFISAPFLQVRQSNSVQVEPQNLSYDEELLTHGVQFIPPDPDLLPPCDPDISCNPSVVWISRLFLKMI
ncbi:hypothetical protein XENORESO_021140 [Xenotaenia resolanae]|uniref:Uncharacterized protein n=1 Tax=Xenotaenia resolanae TaxID=208358 RepID=A0ABV0VXQ0_9TELE